MVKTRHLAARLAIGALAAAEHSAEDGQWHHCSRSPSC